MLASLAPITAKILLDLNPLNILEIKIGRPFETTYQCIILLIC